VATSRTTPNRRIEHVDGQDQANTGRFAQKALAFLEINLQCKQLGHPNEH
jgi:hypothetical protein